MLTPDPIDPNRFHTTDATITIGFSAANTNNLPNLVVNDVQQALTPETVGAMNFLAATFPLITGNNVLSIGLVFTGSAPGSPPGKYEIHEITDLLGQKFAFFVKSRQESEPPNFFLIIERP